MRNIVTKIIGWWINVTALISSKWNAEMSFKLLCKVRRVGFTKRGKQFLDTATTSFMEVEGHSAALHRWGTGKKKILLLHGWMSNSQRWRPYLEKIDLDEFTVYALDFPGHGMAKGNHLNIEICRKAVLQVIEQTGTIETLIGHSLGCLVASYTYLENPDLPVKQYVIMGSPSGMDAIFEYFKSLLGLSSKAMRNLSSKVNTVLKIPHQEISMVNFFKTIKKPVMVVHDETDTITPFEPISEALQHNKDIALVKTQTLKHDLKSEVVYTAVTKFIKNNLPEIPQKYSA